MTSERWCPEPYDDTPYANAPGEKLSQPPQPSDPGRELTADSFSPSAPVTPAGAAAGAPAGALAFHCAACLLEWEENYCDICGAENLPLSIDRPSSQSIPVEARGAEGDPC